MAVRPLRPEDEPALVKYHEGLSDRSIYLRFLQSIQFEARIAHERLSRICFIDYDREIALCAEGRDPSTGELAILGISRLTKIPWSRSAVFNLLVADHAQSRGLGTELMSRLIDVARGEGLRHLVSAEVLGENQAMLKMGERFGMRWVEHEGNIGRLYLDL